METLTLIIMTLVVIAALVVVDLLALRYGVDSRETVGDDHARHAGF